MKTSRWYLQVFATYFVLYTLVYTLLFVLITNIKDIISALKNAISSKDTKETTKDTTAEEKINGGTSSNNGTLFLSSFVKFSRNYDFKEQDFWNVYNSKQLFDRTILRLKGRFSSSFFDFFSSGSHYMLEIFKGEYPNFLTFPKLFVFRDATGMPVKNWNLLRKTLEWYIVGKLSLNVII